MYAADKHSGAHVMLDYDDFNSQYSLESMQILFEEFIAYTGYDTSLGERMPLPFEKSKVFVNGQVVGTLLGTLMSSHRMTTFINTVLNEAYILCSAPHIRPAFRLHVGDDVYIRAPDSISGGNLLRQCQESGLRMNPTKQSFGMVGMEFLRVVSENTGAYGYFARNVTSTVSGTCDNEVKVYGLQALQHYTRMSRTLKLRSGCEDIWCLLIKRACSVSRTKKIVVLDCLSHNVAISRGLPMWGRGIRYKHYNLRDVKLESELSELGAAARKVSLATDDYLSKHATAVEIAILLDLQTSLKREMVDSTYSKTLPYVDDDPIYTSGSIAPSLRCDRRTTVSRLLSTTRKQGALEKYPLLLLMKNRLGRRELSKALRLANVPPGITLYSFSWYDRASISIA